MKWCRGAIAGFALFVVILPATAREGVVHYDMDVALDPEGHRLTGSQRIRWTNRGGVSTSELWWHLYLNAFASSETTFMKELGGQRFRWLGAMEDDWGWIRITRLALSEGTDLLPGLEFVRPDDNNPDDYTVARLPLPREVPPGAAVELEVDFEARLPRVVARTGHAGDFHFVGQWFPKLGVYEGEAGWNCHQFHAASEFYADFGSYRVAVTVPGDWVVGATGLEVARETTDNTRRLVFVADRVHDFAWCAAPGTQMTVLEDDFEPGRHVPPQWLDRVRSTLGSSSADLELPPMHVRVMVPRSQQGLAERTMHAARLAIAWFGLHYGPYPYPQLTVVSPPRAALEAGGMEYPTLITTGTGRLFSLPLLVRAPHVEAVTVHEFGHQYFYGLLASNEFEQAWLDEGFTSFAEIECMTAIGADRLAPSYRVVDPWALTRIYLLRPRLPLTIDQYAWEFRNLRAYDRASYDKAAVALKTLEGLVGKEEFAQAMRAYVTAYRHAHPTAGDMIAVFEEVTGEQLDWFFEQAFQDDVRVDWAVLGVRHASTRDAVGMRWEGGQWLERTTEDPDEDGWSVTVEIGRKGEFVGPVDILLRFENGDEERRTWNGRERWMRWRIDSDERLVQVVADPDGVWALETDRGDNYWRADPSTGISRRHLWWIVEALRVFGFVHLPWS